MLCPLARLPFKCLGYILFFFGWFAFCIFEMLEVGLSKDSGTFMAG